MANNDFDNTVNSFGNSMRDLGDKAGNMLTDGVNTAANAVVDTLANSVSSSASPDMTTGVGTTPGLSDGPQVYDLTKENQWGWIFLYVVTIVIAVLGNLLFIVSCLCTKRTRTTGYYLLINLSIRDILLAGLCIPFTMDSEVIRLDWMYPAEYCIVYRYFYYCFLFFLPLTLVFLAWHLFVENCKWNFAGEEGSVPRPWPHTIYLPMIWFFSAAFAVPTVWWTDVRPYTEDLYKNDLPMLERDPSAKVCMHKVDDVMMPGSNFFFITSTLVTFCIPVIMLFIPWMALLVQICGCCTRRLRSSEFWLSIITLFMVLFFEASRAPFELYNFHYILTNWSKLGPLDPTDFPEAESFKAVMKWAVYAPALLHPLLYFTFSPEARHGCCILFSRLCSCCCTKSGVDVEVASDDEKGQMLNAQDHNASGHDIDQANVPLQSKQEEEM